MAGSISESNFLIILEGSGWLKIIEPNPFQGEFHFLQHESQALKLRRTLQTFQNSC
jgi:hypothetical protein